MLRTLDGTGQPAVGDGQMSPATQAHIARIAQSPIITQPARTIARGILLGMLAVLGFAIVLLFVWIAGAGVRRYFHLD